MEYRIWKAWVPGHRFASVQAELGLTPAQIRAIRWGEPLEPVPDEVTVTSLTRGPLPDVMSSGWGGRYLNLAAKHILESFARDVTQFVPACLAFHLGDRGHRRWILNVTARRPMVDRERSDWSPPPGDPHRIRVVRRLALLPLQEGPALLHPEELPFELLVRADLAEALQRLSSPGGVPPRSAVHPPRRGAVSLGSASFRRDAARERAPW